MIVDHDRRLFAMGRDRSDNPGDRMIDELRSLHRIAKMPREGTRSRTRKSVPISVDQSTGSKHSALLIQ